MKFFGEPNQHIIDYENLKEKFVFDEKGEFVTEDEKLIKWIRANKNFLKFEDNTKSENIEVKIIKCKKCGKPFENMGFLLSHSKKCGVK